MKDLFHGASSGDKFVFNLMCFIYLAESRAYYDVFKSDKKVLKRVDTTLAKLGHKLVEDGNLMHSA